MMQKRSKRVLPLLLIAALFIGGAVTGTALAAEEKAAAKQVSQEQSNTYKGKIEGVSKKAKSISISVGKGETAKTMMVKFDDNTKGMEFAEKGEAAIITFEMRGKDKVATVVKPKLAQLPEGVAEMQPEQLIELVAKGPEQGNYFLVDSRPAKAYAEGHVPSAVSIPVEKLEKEGGALLPAEKDFPLIFHCGGPT